MLTLLAHGVGGRQDLPLPLWLAATGAAVALVVSFAALGLLWTQPRLGAGPADATPLPALIQRVTVSRVWPWFWRLVGLVIAGYFTIGLVFGPDDAENPTAGAFYVLFWIGLVPLSLLFGPAWRGLNPLRTLHLLACRLVRREPLKGLRWLRRGTGYWPAAVGLLAFAWLELAAPERSTLAVIRIFLLVYVVVTLAGAVVFGSRWFNHADAFEAYSTVIGQLAPIARRRRDGRLIWRNPLDGIARLPTAPGLVAFVGVLLGSTLYDGLSNAPFWVRFMQGGTADPVLIATGGLIGAVSLVVAGFLGATALASRLGGGVAGVTTGMAHSIVPIAIGYVIAHYYSLFLLEGQRTLILFSDPLGTGANWLGTGDWEIDALGTSPMGIAVLQVTAIVAGHLLGVVLAHDKALRLFPRRTAVLGQLPLLVLMVAYTVVGLLLLFAA